MDRAKLQKLAEDRIADAQALLAAQRWTGAYYMAGYAVECALKACVLVRVGADLSVIFLERRFSERCWTHDLEQLVKLAGLDAQRDTDTKADATLYASWGTVAFWEETSRYKEKTETEARTLLDAITQNPGGVLLRIRQRW